MGGYAFVDRLNDVIRVVGPDGRIRSLPRIRLAGELHACRLGQLALWDPDHFVVASGYCARVFVVGLDSSVRVLAGSRRPKQDPGDSNDRALGYQPRDEGKPAVRAGLDFPMGVAVDGDRVLIADDGELRQIDARGRLTTLSLRPAVASGSLAVSLPGTLLLNSSYAVYLRATDGSAVRIAGLPGQSSVGGDGGRGVDASFGGPTGVAPTRDGRVLIPDFFGHRVREVAADGSISTIAGTGVRGFRGDGGAPVLAWLSGPNGIAPLDDGGYLLSDAGSDRIRRVSAEGVITTVAGSGLAEDTDRFEDAQADFEDCRLGCGDTDYDPLFNYLYFDGRPLTGRAGAPLSVTVVSSRAAAVRLTLRRGRTRVRLRKHIQPGRSRLTLPSIPHGNGRCVIEVVGRVRGASLTDRAQVRLR